MTSTLQLISVSTIALLTGCCLGALLTLPKCIVKKEKREKKEKKEKKPITDKTSNSDTSSSTDYLSESEEIEEEEEEVFEINSTALNDIPGEVRMALVVRTDLGMLKGKIATQCSHAAVSCYKLMSEPGEAQNLKMLQRWNYGGTAKITLKCKDEEEMDLLFAKAISLGVNAYMVHDAGRTQIAAGSATVLGLGPAPKQVLDQITGELKLY